MIGKLRGKIDSTDDDSLIIDVGGVGYHVFCARRTIAALASGDFCELIIETNVREDHIHLYGFVSANERDWFRLLVSVQGVGNRIALAILSAYPPDALVRAIIAKDISAFKAISGIGPKLAERIVVELKDKALKLGSGDKSSAFDKANDNKDNNKKRPNEKNQRKSATEDAISALVNFGYSRSDAYTAALKALETLGKQADLDELIRASLKEVARK